MVQALGEDDDSPFLGGILVVPSVLQAILSTDYCLVIAAGQLHGGASSLSVESGLFRSLAHPYSVPHTDFLLVRMPVST
jgi:hypothetical protein